MHGHQRTYLYVGAAGLLLLLLYRYVHNNAAANVQTAGTQTGASDPMAAEYASLAGQEQSDMAALQQQDAQLAATEQSDVQTLSSGQAQFTSDLQAQGAAQTGALQGFQAQEQSDVAGLMAGIGASVSQAAQAAVQAVGPTVQGVTQQVAAVASGQQAISRATIVHTRPGGAFFNWYKAAYHRSPPAVVNNANPIYEAWQRGVKRAVVVKNHPKGIV